jgi:hypothetical protein
LISRWESGNLILYLVESKVQDVAPEEVLASFFPAMRFTNELFPAPIWPKTMKFAGAASL